MPFTRRSALLMILACTSSAAADGEGGEVPSPPLGWSSGRFGCEVDEQLVRDSADALVSSGMKAAGYQYIVIDGCWQSGRDGAGAMVADAQRFPSGMKALANYVHARGLKFALYPEAGELACRRRAGGDAQRDSSQLAAWSVDAIRYDWCAAGAWKDTELPPPGKAGGTFQETRALFGLWAVLGAPLIAGNDVRNLDELTRTTLLNRQVISVNQDELGAPGKRLRRDGDLDVWVRPLHDGAYALLLLNHGAATLSARVNWSELGLPPRASLQLRDLWSGRTLGRQRGGYMATLAPHGTLLVRAIP